jgi:hypothetical protein
MCTQNRCGNTLKINRSSNMKRIRSWFPLHSYPDEPFLHSMTLLIGFEDRSPPLRFESLLNSSSVSRWLLYTHGTLLKPTQRFSRSFHGEFPSPLASRIGVYERKVKLVQRGLTSASQFHCFSLNFGITLCFPVFCIVLFVSSPTRVQSAFSRCLTFSSHISRLCFPARRRRARSARRSRSKSRLSALSDRSDLIYDTGTSSH